MSRDMKLRRVPSPKSMLVSILEYVFPSIFAEGSVTHDSCRFPCLKP